MRFWFPSLGVPNGPHVPPVLGEQFLQMIFANLNIFSGETHPSPWKLSLESPIGNHHFLGDMLVFRGVYQKLILLEDFWKNHNDDGSDSSFEILPDCHAGERKRTSPPPPKKNQNTAKEHKKQTKKNIKTTAKKQTLFPFFLVGFLGPTSSRFRLKTLQFFSLLEPKNSRSMRKMTGVSQLRLPGGKKRHVRSMKTFGPKRFVEDNMGDENPTQFMWGLFHKPWHKDPY